MLFDAAIVLYLNQLAQNSSLLSTLTVFFASYFPWGVIIALLFWITLLPNSTKEKVSITVITFNAILISRFVITEIIRAFIHRARPYLQYPDIHALFSVNEWSFPSGHATIFFSIATIIFLFNRKAGATLFVVAILISIARVAAGVHFPTDIVGGMGVGVTTSLLLYNLFYKDRKVE